MDDRDRTLLTMLQGDFPLEKNPIAVVAGRLGMDEGDVRDRVKRLKEEGVIRRIGAVFDREALGWEGTLCAAKVPGDRLDVFVGAVNAIPGVTHNYRRNHDWNVWFTLIAASRGDIDRILETLRAQTGITDIVDMKTLRTFKINAAFDLRPRAPTK
ncbi:MAG: Lrp/AsnC family transcriptional regulator [Syntrophales bacterium]|jgi:DNA-binding Lrp family transcriptional regulator|nr:Lrp/AsnC family transcriptional regulator [Syntrophales bacterium]